MLNPIALSVLACWDTFRPEAAMYLSNADSRSARLPITPLLLSATTAKSLSMRDCLSSW
ncbi:MULTISPECIES: hypothetical protein [Morganellaceae]|uniref:Uncharacterized protein n=2 Tax=Moellerella wisconsensis TaxID=158849 RepID=A0ACD3YFT7_9GAMM|nr:MULTISPECIES: hypothetical protein [Morganellaceae]UNH29203.1 hypothetical protein MNY64_17420 [Moellerella wisconsensis]UNH32677.1 hypothetical protein MNY72_16970 [Moellerella wisconsensis]UNH40916.1 hypothetical protein MNY70_17075 [Moellerella wisconsensis]UNH44428.1 hypothetical protein MNY66_16025 [Moellerella wisconsensis]WJW83684.1 hypothetical protein QU516_15485 [Moellerella wisconsensis]